MKDDPHALQFTGYRIHKRSYREVRDIMSEFDMSEKLLCDALRMGHNIDIDPENPALNLMLYIVEDQQQREKLSEYRIPNPTLCQLIGTSRIIRQSEKEAVDAFQELMKKED